MEKISMMEIKTARFLNSSKTLMEIELVRSKTGKPKLVTINVPENREKGKDPYFDMVLEKFNIDQLDAEFNEMANTVHKKREWQAARQKTEQKGEMLNTLFKKKVEFLNSKILGNSNADQRRAIRKANTFEKYQMIQTEIVKQYADENNISFFEAVMLIDEPAENKDQNNE